MMTTQHKSLILASVAFGTLIAAVFALIGFGLTGRFTVVAAMLIILASIITTLLVGNNIRAVEEVRSRTGRNDIPLFNPQAKAQAERVYEESKARAANEFKSSVEMQISAFEGQEYVTFEEYVDATSHVRSLTSHDPFLSERIRIIDQRMEIKFLVKKHFFVLQRKVNAAVIKNDYGMVIKDNTNAVWQEFLTSVGFNFGGVSPCHT